MGAGPSRLFGRLHDLFEHERATIRQAYQSNPDDAARNQLKERWDLLVDQEKRLLLLAQKSLQQIKKEMLEENFFSERQGENAVRHAHFPLLPALFPFVAKPTIRQRFAEDIADAVTLFLKEYGADHSLSLKWLVGSDEGEHVWHLELEFLQIKESKLAALGLVQFKKIREKLARKKVAPPPPPKPEVPETPPEDTPVQDEIPEEPEEEPVDDETEAFITSLFTDPAIFEQEILQVENEEERLSFAHLIATETLKHKQGKFHLDFRFMESYDQYNFKKVPLVLKDLFQDEVIYFLTEENQLGESYALKIREDKEIQSFLLELAKRYTIQYAEVFKNAIADSYFEAAAQAPTMTGIIPIIQESINGTSRYKPIFETGTGRMAASKDGQVWMRARQAKIQKEKVISHWQNEVKRLESEVYNLQRDLEAFDFAKSVKLEDIKSYKLQELRDVILNENNEFAEEKRVLRYIPAGEMTVHLIDLTEKGYKTAPNEVQRDDYLRAYKFFSKVGATNNPQGLKLRQQELNQELPKKEESLARAKERLELEEGKGLEAYDEALSKMKEALLLNLGHKKQ